MTITVVVPARNAAATIGRTLAALAAQQVDVGYEVIVVDSGSSDETTQIVASSGAAVLLRNPHGEPASSRNLGARHGSGALLAFTDADCEPACDWLAAGHRALMEADLVQGRVSPIRAPGPFDRTLAVEREHGLYETANLFVTRELFDRIGGFQPLPFLDPQADPFGEDVWFAWRPRRAGARTAFAPQARVGHEVFARGPRDFVAERARCRYFPPLVALIPELRDGFLHRSLFLTAASMRFDLVIASVALGLATPHRRCWLAPIGTAPYAMLLARKACAVAGQRRRLLIAAVQVSADAVALAALLRGSVSARTLVL